MIEMKEQEKIKFYYMRHTLTNEKENMNMMMSEMEDIKRTWMENYRDEKCI